jgi:hypothetical protein
LVTTLALRRTILLDCRLSGKVMKVVVDKTDIIRGRRRKTMHAFDGHTFLNSAGIARTIVQYRRLQKIYTQGDPAMRTVS